MGNIQDNWAYIKNFKMNSLFWRTFLIISALLIIPFISLGIIFYSNTFKTMKNEIMIENRSMLNSTKNIIDNTLNECDMMSSYIASNDDAQAFMLSSTYAVSLSPLANLSNTIPLIYKYIDSVYIYSEYNDSVFAGKRNIPMDELTDKDWTDSYNSLNDRRGIIIPRIKNNSYPPLITIIKPIYVADEKKGAVIMNINSQTLYRSIVSGRYKSGQEFFLVDNDNRILMSKDISYFNKAPEDIGFSIGSISTDNASDTFRINGESNVILHSGSGLFGFSYISIYPMTLYESQLLKMKWHIFFISLLLLVFCFVLAYVISVKSYTPLREIISFLDKSTPDDISTEDKNELIYIINSISLHIENKEKMQEILEERMNMLKKAQYDMLQAQINPHFLYNTLETINWMAYNLSNSENPVSNSLVSLANFFRNTLSSSGYLISIEDEIKYTKDYINILELRYGDLFDIAWDIDESIFSFTIIKICLQPIIENAVYHGFKPKNDKGLITVSGTTDGNNIVISIRDDGVGMSIDKVNDLNTSLNEDVYTDISTHIGLANVNKRIKIIFGDDYGIHIESRAGEGTCVYIIIPLTQ